MNSFFTQLRKLTALEAVTGLVLDDLPVTCVGFLAPKVGSAS